MAALLGDAAMIAYNNRVAARLAGVRNTMKTELGLDESDIIDLPILYANNAGLGGFFADAFTGGVVNMLVADGHCGIAKPFGPVVGGLDQFEQDVRGKLQPLGLTLHFIDDWTAYHLNLGEVHCGTHTLRHETQVKWWQFEP